jgi:hypothetical protein
MTLATMATNWSSRQYRRVGNASDRSHPLSGPPARPVPIASSSMVLVIALSPSAAVTVPEPTSNEWDAVLSGDDHDPH